MNLSTCVIWLARGDEWGTITVQADEDQARYAVLVGEHGAVDVRPVDDDEDHEAVVGGIVTTILAQICGADPTWEIVRFDGATLHLAEWLADSVAVGDA